MKSFTLLFGFILVIFLSLDFVFNSFQEKPFYNYKRNLIAIFLLAFVFIVGNIVFSNIILFLLELVFGIGVSVYLILKNRSDLKNWDVIHAEKITFHKGNEGTILNITFRNGKILQFKYQSRTWYNYPMMNEPNTFYVKICYNVLTYLNEHGNSYPNAHKTKVAIPINTLN